MNVVKHGTNFEGPVVFQIPQYFILGSTDDVPIGCIYGEMGKGVQITLCKAVQNEVMQAQHNYQSLDNNHQTILESSLQRFSWIKDPLSLNYVRLTDSELRRYTQSSIPSCTFDPTSRINQITLTAHCHLRNYEF